MNLPSVTSLPFTLMVILPSVIFVTVIVSSCSNPACISLMINVAFDLTAVNTVKLEAA